MERLFPSYRYNVPRVLLNTTCVATIFVAYPTGKLIVSPFVLLSVQVAMAQRRAGELTKSCISTSVRCNPFRRTKDAPGPRRRGTKMSTPEKKVGVCVMSTVSTDLGQTRSRWDLEKSVPMAFCISVGGSVWWK